MKGDMEPEDVKFTGELLLAIAALLFLLLIVLFCCEGLS